MENRKENSSIVVVTVAADEIIAAAVATLKRRDIKLIIASYKKWLIGFLINHFYLLLFCSYSKLNNERIRSTRRKTIGRRDYTTGSKE
jgi:hypothetical protein